MQVKQEVQNKDWHQQLLADLISSPLVSTRVGFAFVSIGHLLKFNLSESFPATRAKKLFFNQVKRELYCFLKGQTSAVDLHAAGVTIWDKDLNEKGADDIGPIYGYQWRMWPVGFSPDGFDQLRYAIDELKHNRHTRRALISAWNPPQIFNAVLPPCHVLFQFNIINDTLYTDVYQRSADAFLGLPFDVASFAIMSRLVLTELKCSGLDVSNEVLNYHISNLHLYKAHKNAAEQELSNEPSPATAQLYCGGMTVDDFKHERCMLVNYFENRIIKAPIL